MKSNIKRLLVILVIIIGATSMVYASGGTGIILNGKELDTKGDLKNGTTNVSVREIFEELGYKVSFKNSKIYLDKDSKTKKAPVRVTTLIENSNDSHENLIKEHGISMYIETEDGNILFDTSKSDNYIKNAEKLGIDLKDTNHLVLSHAHYDHCGGVKGLIEKVQPSDLKVHLTENFFDLNDKYHYQEKEGPKMDFTDGKPGYTAIGIDFDREYLDKKSIKVNYFDADEYAINDQVSIFTNFGKSELEPFNKAMKVKLNGDYVTDEFKEEVALALDTEKGIVILTGCSHTGIINIVSTIKERTGKDIYAVVGGTHLVEADEERTLKTLEFFKNLGVEKVGLSHCTGQKAVETFEKLAPDMTFVNSTGTVLEFK